MTSNISYMRYRDIYKVHEKGGQGAPKETGSLLENISEKPGSQETGNHGLRSRVLASHVHSPRFNPQHCGAWGGKRRKERSQASV